MFMDIYKDRKEDGTCYQTHWQRSTPPLKLIRHLGKNILIHCPALPYDEKLIEIHRDRRAEMRVAFTTLGCRTNQNDTAEMQAVLEDEGFSVVGPHEPADIFVINTCTVTAKSDANSRLAVKKSLALNEDALVVFTGCYAQTSPEEAAQIPGLDIVLGNANKLEIGRVIRKKLEALQAEDDFGLPLVHMTDITQKWDFKTIPLSNFQGKTKAFIKVQTGCNETCSFCTVVHARGRSISDSRENVLTNVRQAVAAGYKEITLTGINLGTYGMDLNPLETFSSLVREIADLPGEFRVRISSINPMEIDGDLLRLIADHEKVCPHLHIPLQSGDDATLSRMRRNYNIAQYRQVVARAVDQISHLGLGADVIVGFPGETEENFEKTYRLIEELPFSYLHVFTYSPRKGTDAYLMKENIPKAIKKLRNRRLTELGHKKSIEFRQNFLNRIVNVLVEGSREGTTGKLRGHTQHYIPVSFDGEDSHMNRILPITIEHVSEQQVSGCLAS